MKKTYKIQVTRTYTVIDVIDVEAESTGEAHVLAEQESDNKDYTGQLKLDEVNTVEL